jgi:hypothetical protein
MEKLIMIWDEIDDLRALAPRLLTAIAGIGLIVAAAFLNRL